MGKVFPIKQGVACQLKWTWNTVRLAESTTACCHRVTPVPLTADTFDNFHNHPVWLSHRQQQLQGQFLQQGCQYCGDIEAVGGTSDRLLHLQETDIYPPELDQDINAIQVTPRILEVFINNACNMACIYCDESNSSRIEKENRRYGYDVPGVERNLEAPTRSIIPIVPRYDQYSALVEKFFSWVDSHYHTLRRLQVLGGEPFYQREFDRLVDMVCERDHPDLVFNVVTNLMVSRPVLEKFILRMKSILARRQLKQLHLTVSIDCWGQEQEYVRWGLDLEQWYDNFQYLVSQKWIFLSINSTITSLTIKTMPDLLDKINALRSNRHIHHAFSIVDFRPHFHPGIMPKGFWSNDFKRILSRMPTQQHWDQTALQYMKGIRDVIDAASTDSRQQTNLRCYLDEIDRRRGLDWRSIFPWLPEIIDKHHVVL